MGEYLVNSRIDESQELYLRHRPQTVKRHASRMRNRSRGRFTCPLVIRAPYGAGIKAPELHEESAEAFFCHMPGIKVVVPSGPLAAKGLLTSAIRDPDPVIFLEPTRLYRLIREEFPDGEYALPLGTARVAREGDDVTVIAWGSMLERVEKSLEQYNAEIIDLLTLSPCDWDTVLRSVRKTGRAVIVHEAPRTCGFGAELAATIAEEAILSLRGPVLRVTGLDAPVPLGKLVEHYLPDSARIRAAVEDVLRY